MSSATSSTTRSSAALTPARTSVPSMGHSRAFSGSLWDVHTFDVSSIATAGVQSLSLAQLTGGQDALVLVVLLFDTAAGSTNTPPVASDLSLSGFEDQPLSGQLPGFDADGNALTFAIESGPRGRHSAVQFGNRCVYLFPAGQFLRGRDLPIPRF